MTNKIKNINGNDVMEGVISLQFIMEFTACWFLSSGYMGIYTGKIAILKIDFLCKLKQQSAAFPTLSTAVLHCVGTG